MQKRFRSRFDISKVIFFFLSLFFGSYTYAQNETDTIAVSADTVEEVIETTTAPQEDGTTDEEKKVNYFVEKDQPAVSIDSLHLRSLPGSAVKNMQNDKDYWYANADIKKKKPAKEDTSYIPLVRRKWFQNLLWFVIIAGFAGFIMWYLSGSNVSLFRKKAKAINDEEQDEVETDNIFAINYQKEIDKATQQGNYRFAVRLMFLRLLKNLSEKNIIQYNQGKTNFDYLLQLQPTNYYKDFFRITRNYEYSWYGQFEVNEQAYHIIRNDFDNFDRKLR